MVVDTLEVASQYGVIGAIIVVVALLAWLIWSLNRSASTLQANAMKTITKALVDTIHERLNTIDRRIKDQDKRIDELEEAA